MCDSLQKTMAGTISEEKEDELVKATVELFNEVGN